MTDRALEIAAQWDVVERDLRDPELWAFITGKASEDPTHISLLLDTIAGGPTGRERPLFYTFETLRERIAADPQEFWNEVVDLHSLVLGWHESRDLFHQIGFLIAQGASFSGLIERSKDKSKSKFEADLDGLIRDNLRLSEADLRELSYQSAKTSRTLLLMNVETVRQRKHSSERYSFREHAVGRWSLEHIHAQNAEQLNRAEQWKEWLRLHRKALMAFDDVDPIEKKAVLDRLDQVLASSAITEADFRPLERELTERLSTGTDSSDGGVDSIANLALLDGGDNSALSNSVFAVKRAAILDRDREGSYIPVCTRNVFLKYYSPADPSVSGEDYYDWQRVVLFGATSTNLFEQCLHSQRSSNRAFTLQQSLLLYAVLLHLIEGTEDFPRRLRVLRNLIVASEDEVRRPNMPALVNDVKEIIVNGDLDAVTRFSSNQVEDERRKKRFLDASPELADALFRLEDHPILRGTLSAFEFNSDTFRQRAEAFETAFKDARQWLGLTGVLLASGDYQRQRPNSWAWQFGTSSAANEAVWRYLLTDATRESLSVTRAVLGDFLDGLAGASSDAGGHFATVMGAWLSERETSKAFDWRYYLVKYPSMRDGATGIYYGVDGKLGYSMCMLRTKRLNGYYRDPVLLEVWTSSGVGERVQDPWFMGYETSPRWLRLVQSGVGMRSVGDGFALQGPEDEALQSRFIDICSRHEAMDIAEEGIVLKIPQHDHGDGLVDSADRVIVGAAFLRDLVEAGL